jgi:virginiamycin B lyase
MDPETGNLVRYPMPEKDAMDPHTLVFNNQGQIWFTVQWGNYIGRLDKTSGKVQLVGVPTLKARPYGIKLDSSGRPWVALLGTNALASVDPGTFVVSEHHLPREDARPRRIASPAAAGLVRYAQVIGSLNPQTGKSANGRAWTVSGPMAADTKDRIWFSKLRPNPINWWDSTRARKNSSSAYRSRPGRHRAPHGV